jgi:hypothetical protein
MRYRCKWAGACAALLAFALGACGTAQAADTIKPAAAAWTTAHDFAKDRQARTNLSGAACASKAPPFASCLIVNDEKKYAQFFSIDGTTLVPGPVIRLVAKEAQGDPDAEGAAYDNGFFYATGSHGRGRNPDKNSMPSYVVFRFPVDQATGKPAFAVSEDNVVGVEASTRLHDVIHGSKGVGPYFNTRLDRNGVNIEGLAVKNGRMYLGFRAPSVKKHGFILSVDAAAVFTERGKLDPAVNKVRLGALTGIRDLAAVDDGILILTGAVNDQDIAPAVFLWNERSEKLKKLGELAIPASYKTHKAETLLVLRDEADKPFRVLVMFDGPENGGPTEYDIPR